MDNYDEEDGNYQDDQHLQDEDYDQFDNGEP